MSLKFFLSICRVLAALSVGFVILYCENEVPSSIGMSAVVLLLISSFLQVITFHHSVFFSERFGMRLRVSLSALIYEKVRPT